MKRLRFRIILLAGWLVFFLSLERLLEPAHISSVTYVFITVLVIITLVAPRFIHIPFWVYLAISVPAFLVLKALTGGVTGSSAITLTMTEVLAIVLTTYLAYLVSQSINEFETAIAHITIGRQDRMPEPGSTGEGLIYQEVRRARNHQRPLTLMAVAVEDDSMKVALDRAAREAQLTLMKQYILSGVSKILCDKLEDCDIVVQSDGHFLVALPETTSSDLLGLINRLRQQVSDQVGVELRIGTASLPQDSYTFEGLVEKATEEMEMEMEMQHFVEVKRISVG